MKVLYEWLIWPIKAKRESRELLTSYSPMKLPALDTIQQAEIISEYNNQIAEIGKEKIIGGKTLNYILSGVGFFPTIGPVASITSLFLELIKDFGVKQKIVERRIRSGSASNADDVYLLDKFSRVAKISL